MMAHSEETPETASGESLEEVISTIREAVTSHVEGGASSLALALDELRLEIQRLHTDRAEAGTLDRDGLEALITKIATPMLEMILKDWAEKNLPLLAEQVVREEIEKLSRQKK